MADVTFVLEGEIDTTFVVTEVVDAETGFVSLKVDVIPDDGTFAADLRGVFFDVSDESVIGDLAISGIDATDSQQGDDSVINLGNGVNMNGEVSKKDAFDVGVEFGTQGIGADDIGATGFTLSSASGDLSIDLLLGVEWGVRFTSVGTEEDGRNGSLKISGVPEVSPPEEPPVVIETEKDEVAIDTLETASFNVLVNDFISDGSTLTLSGVGDGADEFVFGQAVEVTGANGATGLMTVEEDGDVFFNPTTFGELNPGEVDTFTLSYDVTDAAGNTAEGCLEITVTGAFLLEL